MLYKLMILRYMKRDFNQNLIKFKALIFSWNYKLSKINRNSHRLSSNIYDNIVSNEAKHTLKE